MTAVEPRIVLEPAAQDLAEATSTPPFLYELGPEAARKVLDDLQAAPVDKLPVDEEWVTVPAAVGDVRVRIVRPVDAASVAARSSSTCTAAGGSSATPARTTGWCASSPSGPVRRVAFVEYTASPEARYPVAIEQGYATAQWLTREGAGRGLDAGRMAVAGESVGGNMTAALALMAKERGDVTFVQASMYYPVTDAAMDTASYDQFATGYYLSRAGDGVVLGRLHPRPRAARGDHRVAEPGDRRAGPRAAADAAVRRRGRRRCATRARPTPPSSAPRACRSRPSATTAPSTTSCCSTR